MAWDAASIKAAVLAAAGGGLTLDATKDTAVEKAITEAQTDAQVLLGDPSNVDFVNQGWWRNAMWRAVFTVDMYRSDLWLPLLQEWQRYLDAVVEGRGITQD